MVFLSIRQAHSATIVTMLGEASEVATCSNPWSQFFQQVRLAMAYLFVVVLSSRPVCKTFRGFDIFLQG